MGNLSINLFTPLWQGGRFVRSLSGDIDDWKHTIQVVGGYWDASYTETVSDYELDDYILNGLGRHVVVKDPALVTIWEGFVNKLTVKMGAFSFVIGPMLDGINRTFVEYNKRDPVTGKAAGSRRYQTEWGDNLEAQERYGIIEKMLSVPGADEATAVQKRDQFLAGRDAWPEIAQTIVPTGKTVDVAAEVFGYVRWLDRVVYNQVTETGDVLLEEKLKSVLLREPNGFFELSGAIYTRELLANGNFEIAGGGGADIWASWNETAGDGTLTNVTTDHKEGANCCGQTAGATANTLVYQDVTVTAGQAYRLTFWSKDMSQESLSGIHDGLANSEFLADSTTDFKEEGVKVGQTVSNTTDVSTGPVEGLKRHEIHGTLSGGTDNDWDVGDGYTIVTGAYPARYRIHDVTNTEDIVAETEVTEFGNTDWMKTTVVFYAPEGCASVRIYLMCADENTKEVRFDAVSIKEWGDAMPENVTFVPAYEDRNRMAWPVIRELLGYGDYLNRQYNWGIYADRKVKFEVAPEEIEYLVSVSDVGRDYKTPEGGRVEEYNLLPGKWVLITDVLVGYEASSLLQNPRAMFIESVEYDAKSGATLNPGKFGRTKQAIARVGLQEL